jgi:hypothetical protein
MAAIVPSLAQKLYSCLGFISSLFFWEDGSKASPMGTVSDFQGVNSKFLRTQKHPGGKVRDWQKVWIRWGPPRDRAS